jgi:hypothetical protein
MRGPRRHISAKHAGFVISFKEVGIFLWERHPAAMIVAGSHSHKN